MEQETKNISHEEYEKLLKKIQEANPQLQRNELVDIGEYVIERDKPRDIRLADVLLAISKMQDYHQLMVDWEGQFRWFGESCSRYDDNGYLMPKWNLAHDSLAWHKENQPETVEFLIKLLVK